MILNSCLLCSRLSSTPVEGNQWELQAELEDGCYSLLVTKSHNTFTVRINQGPGINSHLNQNLTTLLTILQCVSVEYPVHLFFFYI